MDATDGGGAVGAGAGHGVTHLAQPADCGLWPAMTQPVVTADGAASAIQLCEAPQWTLHAAPTFEKNCRCPLRE